MHRRVVVVIDMVLADQLYKSGPGYVRSITCYSDATATADVKCMVRYR